MTINSIATLFFLQKIFLDNFLTLRFNENQRPILAYHTIIALVFVMVCLRYHPLLWVSKSEYLPYEGIQVLLFFSTVATHETSHLFFLKIPIPSEPTACRLLRPEPQKTLPV
jgi:hypothetical protein